MGFKALKAMTAVVAVDAGWRIQEKIHEFVVAAVEGQKEV